MFQFSVNAFYTEVYEKKLSVYCSLVNTHLHFVFVLACILNIFRCCFIASYLVNKIIRRAEQSKVVKTFSLHLSFKDANTEATKSAP